MADATLRPYDPDRDREAAIRIWREVGWIESETHEKALDSLLGGCAVRRVGEVNGTAECLVNTTRGSLRYVDEELALSCVTGVTTSRTARRAGLAKRLLAQALAEDAANGAVASELGAFDQGFYDQLGFGTGTLEPFYSLDPQSLRPHGECRVPVRLTVDDGEDIHGCRLARRRGHGAVNVLALGSTQAELLYAENGFGFGFRNGADGRLTHHAWLSAKDVESGPYSVWWMAFRTSEQFHELLAVMRSWGDQVHLVRLAQPPGIQLQDLIERPMRSRRQTEEGKHEVRVTAAAYWQIRILDLVRCLEDTHLEGVEVRFNLTLEDPIAAYLESDASWRGLGGEYVVTLGPSSSAVAGSRIGLPYLRATVGAFSRMWLGVLPASALAWTDRLSGPPELLDALDRILRLPPPHPDWEF